MRRWGTVLGLAFGLVAVTGIGFAAFTSQATIGVNASAGSMDVVWVGPSSPAVVTSASYVNCAVTLSATAVTWSISNLAPGDSCTIPSSDGIVLDNIGTIPATMSEQAYISSGSCGWYITYNYGAGTIPVSPTPPTVFGTLAGGATAPAGGYSATFGFDSGQGDGCQGASISLTVYYNATAGT